MVKIQFIFLSFLLNLPKIQCYNVDVMHPLIISNLADGINSHFGAQVTLLPSKDLSNSWVIIGAPKSNSTREKLKKIHEPGVVWRCSLGQNEDSCNVVQMDADDEISRKRIDVTNKQELAILGNRNTSWLGGSFALGDSGHFVACANRWTNARHEYHFMNGICYWRSADDLLDNKIPEIEPENYLLPLSQRNDSVTNNPTPNNEFQYTFGQAGFSINIPNEEELILGAPGIFNWRGSVIRYSGGGINKKFAEIFVLKAKELFQEDSYFGYSVTSGNFLRGGQNKIQYAGGAPRGSDLRGKVLVFSFPDDPDNDPIIYQEIVGSQIGSYFGSSIASVDLNGDGLDDLIIGAPHYNYVKKINLLMPLIDSNSTGSLLQDANSKYQNDFGKIFPNFIGPGDEGAVFIYLSNGNNFEFLDKRILFGDFKPFSGFGSAIASIGDINKDGLNDIAIGAPHENDGKGAVYIYLGDVNGVRSKYSQVIKAKSIDLNIQGFGYSISNGADIDGNGYNDLAVGSYGSANVVIFRTRPTKGLELTGRLIPSVTNLPLNITQFEIQSCVSYTGRNFANKIDIVVELSIDIESKIPRVLFQKKNQDSRDPYEKYEEAVYLGVETCTTFLAVVSQPLETFFGKSVVVQQKLSISEPTSPKITKYDLIRSISPQQNVKLVASGFGYNKFCSNCAILDPDIEYTTQLKMPLALTCGSDDFCTCDLKLDVSFKDVDREKGYKVGSQDTLVMQIHMINMEEIALSPGITITWLKRNLLKIPSNCQMDALNQTYSSLICSFGKTLEKNISINLDLEFDMRDLSAGSQFGKEIFFDVLATTASRQQLTYPTEFQINLPLIYSVDTAILASSSPDTLPFDALTNTSFQQFIHTFRIQHYGESSVSNVLFEFQIPSNLTDPKGEREIITTFYPQTNLAGVSMNCSIIQGSFQRSGNYDPTIDAVLIQESKSVSNFQIVDENDPDPDDGKTWRDVKRKKRSIVQSKSERLRSKPKTKLTIGGIIYFDCSSIYVKCLKVVCKVDNYPKNGKASVSFSLQFSSDEAKKLLKDQNAKGIRIKTEGRVSMPGIDSSMQMDINRPDEAEAVTQIKLESAQVPSWVILVSAVGGILLLCGIIAICYAVGCFEFNKKKPKDGDAQAEETVPLNETEAKPEDRKFIREGSIEEVDENDENEENEDEENDDQMLKRLKAQETEM